LATHLGIRPTAVAADDLATLLHLIRATGPRARVLVVGHSDTIPALLGALGCKPQVTIAKSEYDNLFVVVRGSDAQPVLVRLRY
jgi:broad specificity phosphatase PhoE